MCSRKFISERELKYFTYSFKKAANLGKLYFLPKIHKRLSSVPGRTVISNCGTPTEKVSEYLDHILKPVIQESWSYIKDSGDFLKNVKHLRQIPDGAILVTVDVVGLYPSIPHKAGLETLRRRLNERETSEIPTDDIVQVAEFVLKNNFFEFNGEVERQKSGTAIGTKYAPPYACIFMDEVETEFLKSQELQPFLWLRYIDDIFFIWTPGTQELDSFPNEPNKLHPNLKERINFLDLNVSLRNGAISTDLYVKPTDGHQYLHYKSSHPEH